MPVPVPEVELDGLPLEETVTPKGVVPVLAPEVTDAEVEPDVEDRADEVEDWLEEVEDTVGATLKKPD